MLDRPRLRVERRRGKDDFDGFILERRRHVQVDQEQ